jgi:hypothetical protein
MVLGISAKTGSRLFSVRFLFVLILSYNLCCFLFLQKYDLTNSAMNKQRLSFSAAVLMSIFGVGVSLFSTNKLFVAASSSTRSK